MERHVRLFSKILPLIFFFAERCDRAEDEASQRAAAVVKQKEDELHDVRSKLDDTTARLAQSATILEQRGVVRVLDLLLVSDRETDWSPPESRVAQAV